jgi:uncharacterized alkaline shock family protein YloU
MIEYVLLKCDTCSIEFSRKNKHRGGLTIESECHYCSLECMKISLGHGKIREKSKETCIIHYGVENPWQAQEVRQTIKQNCFDKNGVEFYSQTQECKEKVKQTCLVRFGVEHHQQAKSVKEKIKQTCIEKYGVECNVARPEVLAKAVAGTMKMWKNIKDNGIMLRIHFDATKTCKTTT